jgi:phytoene desaturase
MVGRKKIAVIGAGLGGLATAIRLASLGAEVHVYEQSEIAGGKAGEFSANGFRFDTGPSLLTMPFVLDELFRVAGENREDYLHIESLPVLCKYFFPDGLILRAFSDRDQFAGEIDRLTQDSSESFFRYLDYSKRIYDRTAELFLFNAFGMHSGELRRKSLETLLHLKDIDPFRSMHRANTTFFKDHRMVQLFDRYATYNGSNPFRAPATLNIIQHVEYNLGGYYIPSGMYGLPRALKSLADKIGVEFHFGKPVRKILHRNGNVDALKVEDEIIPHDVIISNVDVRHTYDTLLEDTSSRYAKRYRKLEPSSSALVFFWGIRGTHPMLETHNIIFSVGYENEFQSLFGLRRYHPDPTVYIHISSRLSPADAPANCENWFVMINAPAATGSSSGENIAHIRDTIIKKIKSSTGISVQEDILCETVLTPTDIERRTGSTNGSLYGISSNSRMSAFLRQPNRSAQYRGLYFCGGSAHPGGGIPLVLLSGKITAELIKKHELTPHNV